MICEEIRDDLVARLDDELDIPRRAAVDAHLASCRACARELAELRAVGRGVARSLGSPPAASRDSSFEALWARVVAESGERRRGLGFARRRAAPRAGRAARPAGAQGTPSPRLRTAIRLSAIGGSAAAAVAAMVFAVSILRPDPAIRAGGATAPTQPVAAARPAGAPVVATAPQAGRAAAPKVAARQAERPASPVHVASGEPDDAGDGRDLHVPDEVRKHPGMFLDLPIVQRLEKLRNMEAVYRDAPSGEGSG